MDNYYNNREVFTLMAVNDDLTKTIENLKIIIKEQEDTIEYQKYLISSVIYMN